MVAEETALLQYRPLLLTIANEILGNMKDAEDAVQDTFLKWFERDTSHVLSMKAYLITTLKHICFNWKNRHNKLRQIKEEFADLNISEMLQNVHVPDVDMERELSKAYQIMQRKLSNAEKSVYLLREVFNYEYQEIAGVVDKKAENCRKILDRAKKRLDEKNERFKVESNKAKKSFHYFQEAVKKGRMNEFINSLKEELQRD